jgi:hypothetical protein
MITKDEGVSTHHHHHNNNNNTPIYVVVVEDHNDCLEHIHWILRQKPRKSAWKLLHFDSHPDLSCMTTTPAFSCFRPREKYNNLDLYESLESTSGGIAEWILPLVLAGGLNCVEWVKPPVTCRQLPRGRHSFHVGAWDVSGANVQSFLDLPHTALVRVDCHHPYYLDDESAKPTEELQLRQRLDLVVSELNDEEQHVIDSLDDASFWMLDICLDYFCCKNPFLAELDLRCPELSQLLVEAVEKTRWYVIGQQCSMDNAFLFSDETAQARQYAEEVRKFRFHMTELLRQPSMAIDQTIDDHLLPLYEDQLHEQVRLVLLQLVQSVAQHRDPLKLSIMAIEALPNLTLPHESHHSDEERDDKIAKRLQAVERRLSLQKRSGVEPDPLCITIARSSEDGYTPSGVVEKLQNEVLQMIHCIYCGCTSLDDETMIAPESFRKHVNNKCRFRVLFDYQAWSPSSFEQHF